MLYPLNLHSAVCKLYLNKTERQKGINSTHTHTRTHTHRTVITVSDFGYQELGGKKKALSKSNTTKIYVKNLGLSLYQ